MNLLFMTVHIFFRVKFYGCGGRFSGGYVCLKNKSK
jgi:hypothetical protein